MSSISKFCDMKVCETVHEDRKHEHSEMVATETCIADVSESLSASVHKSLQKL
jgi:hypothetical protein